MHVAARKARPMSSGGGVGQSTGRLHCFNIIHRQAAYAVRRLVTADKARAKGASLKSLTLAAHIENKKATYAVTCQVLKSEVDDTWGAASHHYQPLTQPPQALISL